MLDRAFDEQPGRKNHEILRKVLDGISPAIQSSPEAAVLAEVDRKGRYGETAILESTRPSVATPRIGGRLRLEAILPRDGVV